MTTFDIRLFGAIEIRRDGILLTDFRSQKALVLLAYLICENRPVTRDYLAGLGWPEMEQSQALGLLRRSLHDLNSQLPGCLAMDRRTVHFSPTASVTIDIHTLANLIALSDRDNDDLAARADVAILYHAPFLHGVYVDDAPDLESWLLQEQERWQQAAIRVLQRLIQHHTDEATYALALRYVQQMLALEPWREEAQRQAMLLLARTGQVSAALVQYERCRQILQAELGVEPDRETEILYGRIKALTSIPPANLPLATTGFVGREDELAQLTLLLAKSDCRLITIIGAGGMGKTRLALEVARRVTSQSQHTFLHGVAFVALASVDTPEQLITTVAQALAFTFQIQGDLEKQLLNYLQDKELLLLLDNFEHLIGTRTSTFMLKLLQSAPDVKVLITARRRLNLQREQLYWIQGLHFPMTPSKLSAAETTNYSALQLFIATAQRVDANYRLLPNNTPALVVICQLVQGMPLAVELAATWTSVLSLAEIADQIGQNLDFLASEAHDLPLRQRSMRAVFDTSWRLLSMAEKIMFQRLSIFRNGFTLEAAEAVCKGSSEFPLGTVAGISALIGQSLIHQIEASTGERRFLMLETTREYARQQLVERGEEINIHNQHATYFLSLAEQAYLHLFSAQQDMWYQRLTVEQSNFRAALHWWRTNNQSTQVAQLGAALCWFWRRHGMLQESALWLEWALTEMNRHRDSTPVAERGKALFGVACCAAELGDSARAHLLFEEYLAIEAQCDSFMDTYYALSHLEEILTWEGDFQRAKTLIERRLALSRQHAFPNGVADALMELGYLVLLQGDCEKASQYLEESLILRREVGTKTGVAGTLGNLSIVCREQGELQRARRLLDEALALSYALGDKAGIGWLLSELGVLAQLQQAYAQANEYLLQALALERQLGFHLGIAVVLTELGNLALVQDDVEQARIYYVESVTICQPLGNKICLIWGIEGLAGVAALDGRVTEAAKLLGAAEANRQAIGVVHSCDEQIIYQRAVEVARAALGDTQFDAVAIQGRSIPLEDLIAEAPLLRV